MENATKQENSPDSRDTFSRLLDEMPRIAEAVNGFTSEKNQRAALDALVRAIGIPSVTPPKAVTKVLAAPAVGTVEPTIVATAGTDEDGDGGQETEVTAGAPRVARRRKAGGRKWEPVRDINFRPEGKQAFKDLVAEKAPTAIDHKNVLAVWWLEQVAGITDIGVGHVLAAYKECDWREPSTPTNALQVTASREHWIDTKDMKAISTTPSGRNFVQFDMPLAKKAKKA